MSNALAIAAVTATLRNLLTEGVTADPDLADTVVTMQPLDRARVNGITANQVNIFLYHVLPSGTWRNMDMPGRVRSGESSQPPLGLNLYYLLTAFGRDNDTQRPFSHQLMGRAMSLLNDHPLLGADEIKNALADNDLWLQVERVRFTLQPFSVEEIAKLWTGFQTQYRLSVAYEAAVVLIESARAVVASLPVLKRGADDSGVNSQTNLLSPFPTLQQIIFPRNQTTAALGDTLTLKGYKLSGAAVSVQFSHRLLDSSIEVSASSATDTEITVSLASNPPADGDAALWPAGPYMVAVVVQDKDGNPEISKAMPLALSPKITTKLPMKAKRKGDVVTCTITCTPEVRPEQQVALLIGSQEVPAPQLAAQTNSITFVVPTMNPGSYFIRLRVDGTDSQLVDRTTPTPDFDTTQKVTIP
jgi:hypothetical protein